MTARAELCRDCRAPGASGQPPTCADCLAASDPPVFGVAKSGAAWLRLHRAGRASARVTRSFLESVTVDASAMSHATIWRPRGLDRLTPDEAHGLAHYLYAYSGGALRPHPRRLAIVAAADLLNRFYPVPKLTPRKREPDTYCFRCGEPVPGGLFIGNGRKGSRGFSWVNADLEAPHCTAPATPREAIARWVAEPADLVAAPVRSQLDLFAEPEPVPATLPPMARGAACQLDMFAAAPGLACPHCGARKTYSDGIDDARAMRRAYTCDSCARTWSVDGAQLDLLADPDSAPALRAED